MRALISLACIALVAATALAEHPYEEAKKQYETAYSQFASKRYDQAAPLLEAFVKRCATSEKVPQAYLQLAICKRQLKDAAGAEAAADEIIKRFYGSHLWLCAQRVKLDASKAKPDDYVNVLEAMLRRTAEAPRSLPDNGGVEYAAQYGQYYNSNGRAYPAEHTAGMMRQVWSTNNYACEVARIANTPELAQRVLKAFAKSFNTRKNELPVEWQFLQVVMTEKAGQGDAAAKLWDEYLKEWGDDPRGVGLLVLRANYGQSEKDDKTADVCWEAILQKYSAFGSLDAEFYSRLNYLYQKDRFEDFCKLIGPYLKIEQNMYQFNAAAGWLNALGRKKPERLALLEQTLAQYPAKGHPGRERELLKWKLELLVAKKDFSEAAKLAKELASEKLWCDDTHNILKSHADKDPSLKAVLDEAKKKYGIGEVKADSDAGKKLAELKTRLKEDQVTHAEEVGEEMFGKYKSDEATVEALAALSDYYYAKVQPEPRDKWMDRMIKAYPTHPRTQAVLGKQITAEISAKRYDRLAAAVETAFRNFPPTSGSPEWYGSRYGCYAASKDLKGGLDFAQSHWKAQAAAGDMIAIGAIASAGTNLYDIDNKAIGELWLALGKALPDSHIGLQCLKNAYHKMYWEPYYPWQDGKRTHMAEVKPAIDALRAQKVDPELAWQLEFVDVNYLAVKGDAKPVLDALSGRIKDGQKIRDLSLRLDLWAVGAALGKAKMTKEINDLSSLLKKITFTERDEIAIDVMMGAYHAAAGFPAQAGEYYVKVARAMKYPGHSNSTFYTASRLLKEGKSPKWSAEVARHIQELANVQEILPEWLEEQARVAISGGGGPGAANGLRSRFPHSKSAYDIGKVLESLMKKGGR